MTVPSSVAPDAATATPERGSAPASVAHPKSIRSFVLRAGRTTSGQTRALEQLGPRWCLPFEPSLSALAPVYPQLATEADGAGAGSSTAADKAFRPLVLEIGFGMGEATAHIAALMPATDFLCCEVHPPGVGALLKRIDELGLANIRIVSHDAVEVIDQMLPAWDASRPARGLDGVHIFFPDPWHKKRHHKRRLIQGALLARLAARLKPGAYVHCATDWQPYAEQMLGVLSAEPLLVNRQTADQPEIGGYAARPHYRPLTKFELRGVKLGHGVWDLVFHRR